MTWGLDGQTVVKSGQGVGGFKMKSYLWTSTFCVVKITRQRQTSTQTRLPSDESLSPVKVHSRVQRQ